MAKPLTRLKAFILALQSLFTRFKNWLLPQKTSVVPVPQKQKSDEDEAIQRKDFENTADKIVELPGLVSEESVQSLEQALSEIPSHPLEPQLPELVNPVSPVDQEKDPNSSEEAQEIVKQLLDQIIQMSTQDKIQEPLAVDKIVELPELVSEESVQSLEQALPEIPSHPLEPQLQELVLNPVSPVNQEKDPNSSEEAQKIVKELLDQIIEKSTQDKTPQEPLAVASQQNDIEKPLPDIEEVAAIDIPPVIVENNRIYVKSVVTTVLAGAVVGGSSMVAALSSMALAPALLGGAACATLLFGAAHCVGLLASSGYKKLFGEKKVDQQLIVLFRTATKAHEAYLLIKEFKASDWEFLSSGPAVWLIQPRRFWELQLKVSAIKNCYDEYHQNYQAKVIPAIKVINEAIEQGPLSQEFQAWWQQPAEQIDFTQYLNAIAEYLPELPIDAQMISSLTAVQQLQTQISTAYLTIEPYRQACLKGSVKTIDKLSDRLANGMVNLLIQETALQGKAVAQTAADKASEIAVYQAHKTMQNQMSLPLINALQKTMALQAQEGNAFASRLKMQVDDKVKAHQPKIDALFKKLDMLLGASYDPLKLSVAGAALATTGVVSLPVACVGITGFSCSSYLLAPLVDHSLQARLAKFFSEESQQYRINEAKSVLVEILKTSLISESQAEPNLQNLEDLKFFEEMGKDIADYAIEHTAELINEFALKRYQVEEDITKGIIQPLGFKERLAQKFGCFMSYVSGPASIVPGTISSNLPSQWVSSATGLKR